MTEGWVIMNANMDQYRAWQDGGTVWVKDLADATFYARRVDAEAVHLDDDAAWHVVLRPLPDGGEAVHTGQLRDEPVSSSGSGRDEAALPEPDGWMALSTKTGGKKFEHRRNDAEQYGREIYDGEFVVRALYAAPPPPPVGGQAGDVETVERFGDAIDAATRIHAWIDAIAAADTGKVPSREIRNYTFNEDDGGAVLYFRNNRVAAGGFMVRDLHNFTVSMKVFAPPAPTDREGGR